MKANSGGALVSLGAAGGAQAGGLGAGGLGVACVSGDPKVPGGLGANPSPRPRSQEGGVGGGLGRREASRGLGTRTRGAAPTRPAASCTPRCPEASAPHGQEGSGCGRGTRAPGPGRRGTEPRIPPPRCSRPPSSFWNWLCRPSQKACPHQGLGGTRARVASGASVEPGDPGVWRPRPALVLAPTEQGLLRSPSGCGARRGEA